MGLQLGKPDFMAKSDDGQTISDMYMYITNRLIGLLYVDSIEELSIAYLTPSGCHLGTMARKINIGSNRRTSLVYVYRLPFPGNDSHEKRLHTRFERNRAKYVSQGNRGMFMQGRHVSRGSDWWG